MKAAVVLSFEANKPSMEVVKKMCRMLSLSLLRNEHNSNRWYTTERLMTKIEMRKEESGLEVSPSVFMRYFSSLLLPLWPSADLGEVLLVSYSSKTIQS